MGRIPNRFCAACDREIPEGEHRRVIRVPPAEEPRIAPFLHYGPEFKDWEIDWEDWLKENEPGREPRKAEADGWIRVILCAACAPRFREVPPAWRMEEVF